MLSIRESVLLGPDPQRPPKRPPSGVGTISFSSRRGQLWQPFGCDQH
jgi:hypothetical protein